MDLKEIDGYGGRYGIDRWGNVWNLLKGYCLVVVGGYVNLSYRGVVRRCRVSYLVARYFVPNPYGYIYIRYKDGDRGNVVWSNLEWCSSRQGWVRRVGVGNGRRVGCYSRSGELLCSYGSVSEASVSRGVSCRVIRNGLSGRTRVAGGYIWRYL